MVFGDMLDDPSGVYCGAGIFPASSSYSFSNNLDSYVNDNALAIMIGSKTDSTSYNGCLNDNQTAYIATAIVEYDVRNESSPVGGLITLPSTALASITGNSSQIMSDVWVLIALAIGIPLGFYIIRKVISLIPKK
jgi:hypothetical protein